MSSSLLIIYTPLDDTGGFSDSLHLNLDAIFFSSECFKSEKIERTSSVQISKDVLCNSLNSNARTYIGGSKSRTFLHSLEAKVFFQCFPASPSSYSFLIAFHATETSLSASVTYL